MVLNVALNLLSYNLLLSFLIESLGETHWASKLLALHKSASTKMLKERCIELQNDKKFAWLHNVTHKKFGSNNFSFGFNSHEVGL